MAFQLFADKARQEKMDKAYVAGFDPDAPAAEDVANDAAFYAEYNGDPIRNIDPDPDPEMDALPKSLFKASW